MKIGFLLPGNFAAGNPANGVLAQANHQAQALEEIGHKVVRMNPWEPLCKGDIDVLHFFMGGYGLCGIESNARHLECPIVFAPIIDSNETYYKYRWAARLGGAVSKLDTIPGTFKRQALGSSAVVVRSQHEYNRVCKGLGVSVDKIHIVLNGVIPARDAQEERVRAQMELPERFVLNVSAYTQPRKNINKLIRAAGELGYPLIVAGYAPNDKTKQEIYQLASKYKQIRILGFLPRDTINDLMAACEVFALPSIHEGTGFAALEAAAIGAKVVITGNGGSKDYFGNMVDYVNPMQLESIRKALEHAWVKPKESHLMNYIKNHLSWKRSAESLVNVYQKSLK